MLPYELEQPKPAWSDADQAWFDETRSRTNAALAAAREEGRKPRRNLFSGPKLVRRGDTRLMVDRWGAVMFPQSAYLCHLRTAELSDKTVDQYGRQLVIFERYFEADSDWRGKTTLEADNEFLSDYKKGKLRIGNKERSIAGAGLVILNYYDFAQTSNWCRVVMGVKSPETSFPIALPPGGMKDHPLRKCTELKRVLPLIPTREDLALVEVQILILCMGNAKMRGRNNILLLLLRKHIFRISEIARFQAGLVPSANHLQKKRDDFVADETKPGTVPINVKRSKRKNVDANEEFAITELIELREYIDEDWPQLVKDRDSDSPLLISLKTGGALNPQSLTNLVKKAAHMAADLAEAEGIDRENQFDLRKVRPHHYRHRNLTDRFLALLEAGMDSVDVLLTVMEQAGIRSLRTVFNYLHLAEKIKAARSGPSIKVSREEEQEAYRRYRQASRLKALWGNAR